MGGQTVHDLTAHAWSTRPYSKANPWDQMTARGIEGMTDILLMDLNRPAPYAGTFADVLIIHIQVVVTINKGGPKTTAKHWVNITLRFRSADGSMQLHNPGVLDCVNVGSTMFPVDLP